MTDFVIDIAYSATFHFITFTNSGNSISPLLSSSTRSEVTHKLVQSVIIYFYYNATRSNHKGETSVTHDTISVVDQNGLFK